VILFTGKQTEEIMKNQLRDPLEKLSKSLRRAVSINKSKEIDLKATMNTIQRERRRSFNAWSMRKEKFLRAKQNRMPVLHFEQATLPQRTKTDNSHNTKSEERHKFGARCRSNQYDRH